MVIIDLRGIDLVFPDGGGRQIRGEAQALLNLAAIILSKIASSDEMVDRDQREKLQEIARILNSIKTSTVSNQQFY